VSAVIPSLASPDSSLAFVADGYRYISKTADRLGTDAFRTRLMGRPVTCIRGPEAARMFYEGGRLNRDHAMPRSVFHLLQDEGSVQSLEGESHAHRKQGFLDVLQGGGDGDLAAVFEDEFTAAIERWRTKDTIALHDELGPLFTRTVFRWAGVPEVSDAEFRRRTGQLAAMVERAGTFGPLNWSARGRRHSAEKWARALIADVRSGAVVVPVASPVAAVASWTGDDGAALPVEVAAVELLNLLRPTVALVRFVEFAALALGRLPWRRQALAASDDGLGDFANEVRRRTPFFPVIAGRVQKPFTWLEHDFEDRDWVMLDLYGTNHDARLWREPYRFRPERFTEGEDPRHIVAQGGGDYLADHRCPGEPATNAILASATRLLARSSWRLEPGQDLRVTWSEMPAKIRSGLRLRFA